MVTKKGSEKTEDKLEVVEEALSRSEQFIENNQKIITIIVAVIALIVVGYFGLQKYYIEPKEKEAQIQLFMAEKYFESDSLNKALYGDGNSLGFLDIISDYGMTKSANLSKYYAGICFLKQGDYNEAIKYLKKFDSDDYIVSNMATGAIGDAYVELNQAEKAAGYYMDAASNKPNELTSPMFLFKAGRAYEMASKFDKAVEAYEGIRNKYPASTEGRTIDKYISHAKALGAR
ncbi:MAG: tetratricopeptide repeat protein [Bacteroidetes bacterium]|nr:tetratricopeptide repeat protein [Bacteroidales bacterium]MBU1010696.1 tetratricopeptide repeat protein [Bacteroidota bacterium]